MRDLATVVLASVSPRRYELLTSLGLHVVVRPSGEEIHFDVDPFRKHSLLNGLDDIGQTLHHAPAIDAYERRQRAEASWMPAIAT